MLKKRVIPCLDCKDNVVVKGVSFQNLTEVGDPVALSIRYEAQGADEIVILDVSATREERTHRLETIRAVREALSIPMTVGGGVRSVEDIASFLKAGADKVAINSAAVARPHLVSDAVKLFGSQCIVVSIDCSRKGNSWGVRTRAGTRAEEITALTWAREVADRGAGEILLTSFDNDGRLCGYDCALIESIATAVSLPVIASGGARTAEHMYLAFEAGAAAVLAASLFHIDGVSIAAVKKELQDRGVSVRL